MTIKGWVILVKGKFLAPDVFCTRKQDASEHAYVGDEVRRATLTIEDKPQRGRRAGDVK
jgi:hypothetical protein